MKRRITSLVSAAGALLFTVALVVGVPYLLVSLVGNPFPSELPSVDEVRILLTQNGQGFTNFLIGTLALIIWFIWAQLIAALLVEIVATLRNSQTRRLPTVPGIQALAARLIASITLATTLAAAPVLAPAVGALNLGSIDSLAPASPASLIIDAVPGAASAVHPFANQLVNASASTPPSGAKPTVASTLPVAAVSLVVDDHTELWDLAEAAYGDGVSWKLIAQANAGAIDADGAMITNESEAVAPGTSLVLQRVVDSGALVSFGVVNGQGAATQNGSVRDDDRRVVAPGDSLWTLAQGEVALRIERDPTDSEVARYWADVVDANHDLPSGDVDLIYPGDEVTLPGAGPSGGDSLGDLPAATTAFDGIADGPVDAANSLPTAHLVADPRSGDDPIVVDPTPIEGVVTGPEFSDAEQVQLPDAPARVPARPEEPSVPLETSGSVPLQALGLMAFGAAIFSAGIVGALRRRRDLQRRLRPAGTIARQASSDAAAFEAALAHASHELLESQHGARWRMLPAHAVASMRAAGPMEFHADRSGQIAAIITTDVGAPDNDPRWQAQRIELTDGNTAVAPPLSPVAFEAPESGTAIAPTSLVIGTDTATGEAVFLDLASSSMLGLQGEDEAVRRYARSAVLDLSFSDRADDLCVIAVDVGHELTDLDRVRAVDTFSDALAQAIQCGHALPDSTTPVVVVSGIAPVEDDPSLVELLGLGAVVVSPGVTTPTLLELHDDHAIIWPSGTSVELAALKADDYLAVAELVETTSLTSIELVDETIAVEEVIDVAASESCPVAPGPVEVKVLGPVEVNGAESFSSLKAVDVVTYLAFHRHGVDADQIKTWVWPPFDPPTDKAFANVLSRARTALGTAADGSPFLSRAGSDKTYRLAEEVTTDFDRFRGIVELADAALDCQTTLELLKQALSLIRGVPFTGGAASSFAWADNHVRAQVEYTIDETVHRCADLALQLDDLATARWAALKGLELVPGCEQCFRRRFLVAGAGNNRTELRRAMADLEASAAAELGEPEALDTISGELLELYHELDQALVAGSA